MTSAPVGYVCPQCAARSHGRPQATVRRPRTVTIRSATTALIGVNVLVWLAIIVSGGASSRLTFWLSLLPISVAGGDFWQVITTAFVHVQVFHILFNMMALFFIGTQVERGIGRNLYLGVYGASALMGSAFVMLLSAPFSMTLGASGAIFGLMGVLLVIVWHNHGDVRSVLIWLGINVLYTVIGGSGISWQGHLGGLIGGILAGLVIVFAPRVNRQRWQWAGLAGIALLAIVIIAIRASVLR